VVELDWVGLDWIGMDGTHPIQVALPKKSSMKAMMTKMPQPVMLACALGCACGREATGKDAPWGGGLGVGGGGAVARVVWECGG